MPIIVKDYTWEQTDKMLYITVPLKGVKSQKVDIFSTEDYLKVHYFELLSLICFNTKFNKFGKLAFVAVDYVCTSQQYL